MAVISRRRPRAQATPAHPAAAFRGHRSADPAVVCTLAAPPSPATSAPGTAVRLLPPAGGPAGTAQSRNPATRSSPGAADTARAGQPSIHPHSAINGDQMMFLDCPAYLDPSGAARCGLPAEVWCRYIMRSTDGPVESAMIRCPVGHGFSGAIESLTLPGTGQRDRGTAAVASSVRRDNLTGGHDRLDGCGGFAVAAFPAKPERDGPRPNTAGGALIIDPAWTWGCTERQIIRGNAPLSLTRGPRPAAVLHLGCALASKAQLNVSGQFPRVPADVGKRFRLFLSLRSRLPAGLLRTWHALPGQVGPSRHQPRSAAVWCRRPREPARIGNGASPMTTGGNG